MADEINPNKTTAPGSDNTQGTGGGSSVGGNAPNVKVEVTPKFDKSFEEEIKKQLKQQEEQTKLLDAVVSRLKDNEKSILDAEKRAFAAKERSDKAELAAAEKDLFVAMRFQEENQSSLGNVTNSIKKLQDEMDEYLIVLSDDANVSIDVAKKHLDISKDGREILNTKMKDLIDTEKEAKSEFKQFADDFVLKSMAEEEAIAMQTDSLNKELGDKVQSALNSVSGGTDTASISKMSGLNKESLAAIQETMQSAIKSAEESGELNTDDPKAVERFKMQMMESKDFKQSILKELIKSRDNITQESVQKELQEKYIRQGIPAAIAAVRAEKNASDEYKKRKEEAQKQLGIFKNLETNQLYQTTLIEDDIRRTIEKEKEDAGLPKWYLDFKKSTELTNAILSDMLDTFKNSGLLTKILLILTLVAGVVVGFVTTAIKKIIGLLNLSGAFGGFLTWLKESSAIGKFFVGILTKIGNGFKYISNGFKILSEFINVVQIGAKEGGALFKLLSTFTQPIFNMIKFFKYGMSIGSGLFKLLGKLFLPISIALTVIDGVIGAFKGFKKDGLMGLIPGILAQIVSSLTFGFVKFDTLYKIFKKITDIIFYPINALFKVLGFLWEGVMNLWNLVSDLFSGKGIKAALVQFFDNMKVAFGNFLEGLYDVTIGAFMRLFGFGEAKSKEGKEEGEGILSKIFNILKYLSPVYWIYKGIMTIIDFAQTLYEKVKDFLPDILKRIIIKGLEIVEGLLDIVGLPVKVLAKYYSLLYETVADIMTEFFSVVKSILMIPINIMLRLRNALLGFIDSVLNKLPDFVANYFRPVESLVDGSGGSKKPTISKSAGAAGEDAAIVQAQINFDKAMAKGNQQGSMVITNNTSVSNSGGGGKQQPMTVIAPQPPRNTEPTLRTMQFGEQPAF
jgi:hypothetical protein